MMIQERERKGQRGRVRDEGIQEGRYREVDRGRERGRGRKRGRDKERVIIVTTKQGNIIVPI